MGAFIRKYEFMADSASSKKSSSKPEDNNEPIEGGCRPTFYMSAELLAAIEEQCAVEGNKKRSPFVVELLELVLTSSMGQQMRANAQKHRRNLVHELEANLILFNEHVPMERIQQLAEGSQRNADQMLVRLVLLGLRVYERSLARLESDIEGSSELP